MRVWSAPMAPPLDRTRLLVDLASRVSRGAGTLDPALRIAALEGTGGAGPLQPFVDKVRNQAWDVSEADVDGLRDRDLSEDQIFELTIAAAVGAGLERLEAAMRTLQGIERVKE